MGFLAPWFLAGAVAVGLPVWLHLLRKHKSQPLPFASLMFFEQRTQSSVKHKRLRYLLLFAARTALIILIVLAFAHPYISQTILPSQRSGEVAILAVDNSLSMRTGDRLAQAKQAAKSFISSLTPGHRAQVVAFGQRVQMMNEMTDDRSALNAGVDAIEPSDSRTSFAELSRTARSIAQSIKLPVAVHVYSDMQQTGMPANFNDLRLNADIQLVPHPIDAKPVPNVAVENVVAPRRVYDNKKTRVLVTVANFGGPKTTRSVSLALNGRAVESKSVEVPEGGRATVEFLSLEVPYGRNKGEVKINPPDALPADDTFYFSVERGDPRHVLFVHEPDDTRGILYFKAALEAAGQSAFEIDGASADQVSSVNPSKYAFIVLSDLASVPAGFESQLRTFVNAGGGVLVALGHHSVGHGRIPVASGRAEAADYAGRDGAMFQTAGWLDTGHPCIVSDDRWDGVRFYQAIRVAGSSGHVVARLTDQTPLLLDEAMGNGRVLVFASTFDNIANNFPTRASFVPFIDQTSRYLGQLDKGPSSVLVGSFAELRNSKETGSAVEVLDPKGERALSLEEASKAQNIQFTQSGFYDIRRPNGRNELVAVNADRHESDLAPAGQDVVTLWQNTASGVSSASEGPNAPDAKKPLSLWWYVMLGVLLLAVAESLLGNQHLSVDKEAV